MKSKVSKKKERIVNELVMLMKEYPVVGIIDMTNLPALQFQRIKSKLSDILVYKLVKKRLIKIAFDKVKEEKKGIEQLKEKLEGIPALIFSKEDPFKLAKAIKKEVSAAPAKPGQIAPEDIILPAGPTPFTPGPMIGELGVLGIKTKVESGKINVVVDKVLVKKGDEISAEVASLLSKLGIEPMQVGFNLLLTYRDGEILLKDVLFVDEKLYLDTLKQYARESIDLAMHVDYICKETVGRFISKAENEAKAVSKIAKLEEKKEEVKEQVPAEQKKEEVKVEPKKEPEPEKKEEKPVEEKIEEKKEEPKPEPEKEPEVKEEPKEEKKEEPKEEVKEEKTEEKEEPKEEKLKDIKEETKVGMKPAKDITKEDIDLAAKQLQEIQDNIIKKGK